MTSTALTAWDMTVAIAAPAIPFENDNQKDVQRDVQKTAEHQVIKRSFGVSDGTHDTGTHVIDQSGNDSQKIDAQVEDRVPHNSFRCFGDSQQPWRRKPADDAD